MCSLFFISFNYDMNILQTRYIQAWPGLASYNFSTIQGKCECSKDFIGYSCNVNKTAPPTLTYLRDEGTCNTRGTTSLCRRVSVYGDTFVKSPELKCYAEAVMVSCLMLNVGYLNYYLRILYAYLWKLIFYTFIY